MGNGTGHIFRQRSDYQECTRCGTRSHWPAAKAHCAVNSPSIRTAPAQVKAVAAKELKNPRPEPKSEERLMDMQLFDGQFAKQALQRVIYLDHESVIRAAMATALRGIEPEYAMEVFEACEWYCKRAEGDAQERCKKLLKSLRLLLAANMSLAV